MKNRLKQLDCNFYQMCQEDGNECVDLNRGTICNNFKGYVVLGKCQCKHCTREDCKYACILRHNKLCFCGVSKNSCDLYTNMITVRKGAC